MSRKHEIRAYYSPARRAVEVYVRRRQYHENQQLGEDLVGDGYDPDMLYYRRPETGVYSAPTTVIDFDAAQQLMDDLWAAGLRPTEGQGSAGALSATQAHLGDLRAIVFKQLEIV